MITLITGAPGTGKTALTVSMLLELGIDRPIFQMGIPNLLIDHFPTPPVEEWTEERVSPEDPSIRLPYFTFPDNAIIVVDECQRVYRPRSISAKVPDHVAAFETHRHTGVDFILITQSPNLLDANVRRLVGRHIHIRNTSLGRYTYEWPETGDCESKAARESSIKNRYKLPKKVFKLYKSAETHTKTKLGVHPGLIALSLCLLVLMGGGSYLYSSMKAKISPEAAVPAKQVQGSGESKPHDLARLPAPPSLPGIGAGGYKREDFDAVMPDVPHSARAYDQLRQVKVMPRVSACLASKTRCMCYTQQATRLDITEGECRRIAKDGDFDPYAENAPGQVHRAPGLTDTPSDSPAIKM